MVSSLLLGAAALHSSVARTAQPAQDQERLPRRRLSILIGLILMGPLIVLADVGGIRDEPVNVTVIVGLMTSLSLLLVLRVAFLAQYAQLRAIEQRTQAHGSVALTSSLLDHMDVMRNSVSIRSKLTLSPGSGRRL
ncbi:hypothetical protein [Streptomyces sp. NPDC005760]|uniref:hypothetical protein n=1 Tax=Streptomyces sp. NPDC005760 TaxID=3156718 RepID=UPI0033D2622A